MSFEKFLDADLSTEGFGKSRYSRNFKERQNISKIRLDSDSGCVYLKAGDSKRYRYDDKLGPLYFACTNLTFDAMLTIYDVDTRTLVIYRFADFTAQTQKDIEAELRKFRSPANIEMRLIGLQNDQELTPISRFDLFSMKGKLPIVEVDLFGNEVRHVALDMKTGSTFDILMDNKPYKPGELINKTTPEQFERELESQKPKGVAPEGRARRGKIVKPAFPK